MEKLTRHVARNRGATIILNCLVVLLIFAGYSLMPGLQRVLSERRFSGVAVESQTNHSPLGLRPVIEGDRSINFSESRALQAEYVGSETSRALLESGSAHPRTLAAADFDGDGMPDLLSGYAAPDGGGIITLRRGNVDAVYPNTKEAFARKERGEFVDAPFLSPATVFDLEVAPDFLEPGDFDADGHCDLVAASRGGTALSVMRGDGHGRLGEAVRVPLPGGVTALTVGEINRADGLPDIVVGIQNDEGARALVYESPLGAMKAQPEFFSLPAAATALGLGLLDQHFAYDLAIATGSEVQIVAGRDRRLTLEEKRRAEVEPALVSRHALGAEVRTLVVGDFTGEGKQDVAVLTADGRLQVMRRSESLTESSTPALAGESHSGSWQVTSALSVGSVTGESAKLIATRVSAHWEEDLLLVGGDGQMRVLVAEEETSYGKRKREGKEVIDVAPRYRFGASLAPVSPGESSASVMAALPMRLNIDGLKDVMILNSGKSKPAVLLSQPTITYIVNSAGDQADSNPGDGQCRTAANTCTLRAAIQETNQLDGFTTAVFILLQFFGEDYAQVLSPLPPVMKSGVTIDGSTTDANGQPAKVTIDGSALPAPSPGQTDLRIGLRLTSASSVVTNINFVGFAHTAIHASAPGVTFEGNNFGPNNGSQCQTKRNSRGIAVDGNSATIGGPVLQARNHFFCNGTAATLNGGSSIFQNNFFGADFNAPHANGVALLLLSSFNQVRDNTITKIQSNAVQILNSPGSTSQGNLLLGNQIFGNGAFGVSINAVNNSLGGTSPTARNAIFLNGSNGFGGGVNLDLGATDNLVQNNLVGVDGDGVTPKPNLTGISISTGATGNTIGGAVDRAGNVVSGNSNFGIAISGNANFILQNLIGTDATGTVTRGNGSDGINGTTSDSVFNNNTISANGRDGIAITDGNRNIYDSNRIGTDPLGGADLGNVRLGIFLRRGNDNVMKNNLISGNDGGAVDASRGSNNKIIQCLIGTDAGGTNPIPNLSNFVSAHSIEDSIIAFNNGDGTAPGIPILRTNFFNNTGHGISHVPNGLPNLTAAVTTDESTSIQGTLSSMASTSFRVEHFSNDACDPSGFGEGQTYLGFTNVTTDASGNATINFSSAAPVSAGKFVTATATALNSSGNPISTSSFSQCREVTGSMTVADLSLTKTASPGTVAPGGDITYTITVANAGQNGAGNVTVTDILPAGTTFVSCAATGGGVCSGIGNARRVTFDSLGIGAQAVITLVVRVSSLATGGVVISNTASVVSAITPDRNPGNNSATATTTTATPSADLSIIKTAAPNPVAPGGLITYTIFVMNNGPSDAANVTVTDSLPGGTTLVFCNTGGFGPCAQAGDQVSATRPTLPIFATWTITIGVSISASLAPDTIIINQVNVSSPTPDPNLANNTATATTRTPPATLPASVVISEIRTRGPGGVNDEFLELFNRSTALVDIGGWQIKISDASVATSTIVTINNGTMLPAGGHFLVTNVTGYSGSVPGDQTYNVDIADDGGIGLFRPDTSISDQVGMSTGAILKEGTPLTPLSGSTDQSYERKPGGIQGSTQDTNNNENDFQLIAPSNPQNLSSASGSFLQLSSPTYAVGENGPIVLVTIVRDGTTAGTSKVNYATSDTAAAELCNVTNGNASSRCDYIQRVGTLTFAPGETSKVLPILIVDDSYVEGNETFAFTLTHPIGASLGSPATATITITDNETVNGINPIELPDFFVREHYLDFLNRDPDPGGRTFWNDEILACGMNGPCIEVKRINVSAAFYLSTEFQQTGYLVYRIHKTAFGNLPGAPVPIQLHEFLPDTQEIGRGIVVGVGDWEAQLENNKNAFVASFVTRPRFLTAYPLTLSPAQFVDALNQNAGGVLSQAERDQLVNELTTGAKARAQVLRAITEDADLAQQEFNRAFVLMQYFGYLRRNPNDAPDTNFAGYDFWLNKLNQFNGNFVAAEMVKAFILSGEYRQRFGP